MKLKRLQRIVIVMSVVAMNVVDVMVDATIHADAIAAILSDVMIVPVWIAILQMFGNIFI